MTEQCPSCGPVPTPGVRIDAVNALIARWATRLRVTDWDIRYNPDCRPATHESACVLYNDLLKYAEVHIAEDVPDSELESCVVHEMVHIVLKDLLYRASAYAGLYGGSRVGPQLLDEMSALSERAVEALTEGLLDRRQGLFGPEAERMSMFAA